MSTEIHVAETLLGSPGDMERLNRRVVRVGAAAALFSVVLFAMVGLVSGDSAFYLQAIGPGLVAVFMIAQIATRREKPVATLLAAAVSVVATYRLVGDESTLIPAALGIVIIASISILFVMTRHLTTTLGIGVVLLGIPFVWEIPATDAVALGAIMSVSFTVISAIFYSVRNAATALNRRFQVIFEYSPMAAIEVDWSRSIEYLGSEFSGRSDRVGGFLGAYPDVVRSAASRVRVVRTNQAAYDLLEIDPDSGFVVDGNALSEGWLEVVREILIALVEGRDQIELELPLETSKGRRIWLSFRAVNVSGGDEPDGVLIALADVTHLKAKEDAMSELIQAKDEFVASISHELRTPLTAVVGLTSEMVSGGLGGTERDELIELVAGQAQEMSHIIDDLLVSARAGMGTVSVTLETVDLNAELTTAVEGVGIHLLEFPSALPPAIGDGPRIRQILRNLLTNLERYGGSSRRVLGGVAGRRVWLEVRDNGDGVSEEDSGRIFEPYASAHSGVASSVGLGLSVSRQLAELMGGSLEYFRDAEESVFRLELALARESLFV
ncbi:MAG TPA: HAMP domain-containing sensor histidine kinase [Acidimicrobiia bacterium]|nr:HAMP domain-containing sensor histidine kinase [Acidimicrobiia bacterium]